MEQDPGFYLGDVIQLERGTAGKPGYDLKIVVVSSVPNERMGKLELRDIELMLEDGWTAQKVGINTMPKHLVGKTSDGWRFAITDGCGNFCSAGEREFEVIDDLDFTDVFESCPWIPQELIDEAEQWSRSEIEYLQYGHSAFEDKAIDILQKIVESVRRYRDDEQG